LFRFPVLGGGAQHPRVVRFVVKADGDGAANRHCCIVVVARDGDRRPITSLRYYMKLKIVVRSRQISVLAGQRGS
jgi:hypothetical protein